MNQDQLLQKALIESFVPPPLRLAWSADSTNLSARLPSTHMGLLWLDLVGSTRLASSLIESGEAGIDQLGTLFSKYFDTLLKAVVTHGGQPLMFAGDGLLSGWPTEHSTPREAILRAAQCAEDVLSSEAIKGNQLQVHAALAFGTCQIIEIAVDRNPIHVAAGDGLRDLQIAAQIRASGQLIVSAGASEALGPTAEISSATHGCGVLTSLREHLPPTPVMIPPMPESVARQLATHVPPQIATCLDPYKMDWTPELRRVTAVFAGIPELDSATEDVAARLEAVVRALMPFVRQHDGFLHQLRIDDRGTGLMVLFGTQLATHADDPVRGVRMAEDLKDALRSVGYRSVVGVSTSPALCSLMGNDIFRKYMVFGDAINLASRLKELSEGKIICDEPTMRRARGAMVFDSLGYAHVKGVASPVAIGTPRQADRSEACTPMQGREAELKSLMSALRATAPGKRAQVVVVEGEAGFGKSRLLAEFRTRAAGAGRVLMTSANRIERDVPYHGWRSIYAQLLGIDGIDDVDRCREKVLEALGGRNEESSLLNAVLPLEFSNSPLTLRMSDQQRSRARLRLLLFLLRNAALNMPLVIVIDDAHWLDEASWELAHQVARDAKGLCLILSMQQLDDETPLNRLIADYARRLPLQKLSDAEQERLICTSFGVERVAEDVAKLIVDRANGHPFFCMELAQTLLEEDLVQVADGECRTAAGVSLANLPLPDSVSSTVQRRIDRLAREQKFTLKLASVSGLRFPTCLVEYMYPIAKEITKNLGGWTASDTSEASSAGYHVRDSLRGIDHVGLIESDLVDSMEGYAFRHGIIRDVVYGLIYPAAVKKQLHLKIANWYQLTFAETIARYYPLLAYHFEKAGELNRAAQYLMLEAARVFEKLGMGRESVRVGLRAAELLLNKYESEIANEDLRQFEEVLPTDLEKILFLSARERNRIDALLGERRPDELIGLPVREARDVDYLLEVLIRLAPLVFQSGQIQLFGLIIMTAMRITLEQGNGPNAPEVYALYSIIAEGDHKEKAAWSKLALDLLKDTRDKRFGCVAFIHGWFHNHWVSPLADTRKPSSSDSIELSRAGYAAALGQKDPRKKDIQYGCYNLAACVVYLAAAGHPLKEVMETAREHWQRIGGQVMTASFHVKLELQMAKALAGLTYGRFDLSDREFDEARDIAYIQDTELDNQTGYYFVSRAKLHAHFGDWHGALDWLERVRRPRPILPAFSGQIAECELVEFTGLATLAEAAFEDSGEAHAMKEGQDCIEKLQYWDEKWRELNPVEPSMFGHKAELLAGIKECVGEPSEKAADLLKHSARAAEAAGFLNDAELAFEFLARCYRKAGRHKEASRALRRALDTCDRWGADAKIAFLKEEFRDYVNRFQLTSLPSRAEERAHACQAPPPEEARKV
jgi:predicted ATPase/class 3 adenylate cyclase